jgi:hypothetical protein
MKIVIALLLIAVPMVVLGNIIWGGPGDRIMGFAPGDTLIDTLVVTVKIPSRIGLYVNGNTEFDLGNVAVTYPPGAYPGYYDPTTVSGINADGVDVQVFSNANTLTWDLATSGDGDFSVTIALDQLYYAPDPEANPADGTDPPGGNWVSFTTTYTNIASGTKTSGWQDEDQDYIFQAEVDDEPTPVAGETATIYYRLYAE